MDENKSRSFLKLVADFLMIFLPSIGYFFQAIKFQKTKSSKGFSKSLCLMLLLANILRIYFWIGKPFEKSLLFQSIVVVISQLYLIHFYLKYQDKPKDLNELPPEKSILNHMLSWRDIIKPSKIWNWDYEIDYYKSIFLFFSLMAIICMVIGKDAVKFYEVIGTISVGIETFIEIPQIKENCVNKNVKNLSWGMVLMWFIGDLFRSVYNIVNKSPIQMTIGCLIQNCEDIILSTQVIFYSEDGCVAKILKKKLKNYGIDNYFDIDAHDKRKRNDNDKIDFELDGFSRNKMGELTINNNKKYNNMITVEDDEINIDTDIGK